MSIRRATTATTTGATRRSRTSRPIVATRAIARPAVRRASSARWSRRSTIAGSRCYVDVVYNHTAEGGGSSLLSLRGLDNAGYYQLDAAGTGFTNSNGVGADLAGAEAARARTRARLAALLARVARLRRLSLRSRAGARQRERPGGFHVRSDRAAADDRDAIRRRCADRGAVGRRREQLRGRPLPGRLVGVERQVPRHDPRRIRTRPARSRRARSPRGSPARKDVYASRAPDAGITYLVSHDGFTLHDLYACDASSERAGVAVRSVERRHDDELLVVRSRRRSRSRSARPRAPASRSSCCPPACR